MGGDSLMTIRSSARFAVVVAAAMTVFVVASMFVAGVTCSGSLSPHVLESVTDPEPIDPTDDVNCTHVVACDNVFVDLCIDVCERGTVVVPDLAVKALQFQRQLEKNLPLNYNNLLCTHNSGITNADGYGLASGTLTRLWEALDQGGVVRIANQVLSLTDQIRLGVRQVELDVHWHHDALRVCHAGGVHIEKLNELIRDLAKLFHAEIDWDTESLGCFSSHERLLTEVMDEVSSAIRADENKDEIFVFMFDDQMDLAQWNKVGELVGITEDAFSDLLFRTSDKETLFPNRWPSPSELIALGKRVIFTSGADYGSLMQPTVFYKYGPLFANWTEFGPNQIERFSNCSALTDSHEEHSEFLVNDGLISRVLGDATVFGPFYNGSKKDGGTLDHAHLAMLTGCAASYICLDELRPEDISYAVWSWGIDEPQLSVLDSATALSGLNDVCVMQNVSSSRWSIISCAVAAANNYPVACRDSSDPNVMRGSRRSRWSIGAPLPPDAGLGSIATVDGDRLGTSASSCSTDSTWDHPVNGMDNLILQSAAKNARASFVILGGIQLSALGHYFVSP